MSEEALYQNLAFDLKKVTRVELIDHRHGTKTLGRAFVAWNVSADISVEDDGRTIKVFVTDPMSDSTERLEKNIAEIVGYTAPEMFVAKLMEFISDFGEEQYIAAKVLAVQQMRPPPSPENDKRGALVAQDIARLNLSVGNGLEKLRAIILRDRLHAVCELTKP